jgi:DNA-binding YbaB/EbfC family protein
MNMMKMMKQAAALQKDLKKKQEQLAEKEVEFTSGGGAVKAVATCDGSLQSIKINPEAVDPADIEMLEDLVFSAVDGALKAGRAEMEKEMGALTKGMGGGLPF